MGLFSSKKKTYVNTSVTRAVDDDNIVPSNKMAILQYTMSEDSLNTSVSGLSMTDYLLAMTSNNSIERAKKARRYALKDGYAYGVPKSNMVSDVGINLKTALETVIKSVMRQDVIIDHYSFGPLHHLDAAYERITTLYSYDRATNKLLRLGPEVYMEKLVVHYSRYLINDLIDPDTLIQNAWPSEGGYTPFRAANPKAPQTDWVIDETSTYTYAVLTTVESIEGKKQTKDIKIMLDPYFLDDKPPTEGLDDSDTDNIEPDAVTPSAGLVIEDQDVYVAYYRYDYNGTERHGQLLYMRGAGSNTYLDNLYNVTDKYGEFIPRIYARLDGKKLNKEEFKDKPEYKDMEKLCKRIGMDWGTWVDEIHNSVGSVGDVTQIFMTYALAVNTEDPIIRSYLYQYFYDMYKTIPNSYATSDFANIHADMLASGSKKGQAIEIKDNVYTQRINFSSIGYIDISGSIGEVGTYDSGLVSKEVVIRVPGSSFPKSKDMVAKYHYFRKQITKNIYREIRIYGLSTTEVVKNGKTSTASGDDEQLLIPLDLSLKLDMRMKDKEALFSKALHIVLNTYKVVKKKWYETGIFKAIMLIVAVVISVVTVGAGAPLAAYMYAAAYAVVSSIAIGMMIQLAAKLLVNLGIDVGIVAAVAAVIALIAGAYSSLSKTAVVGLNAVKLLSISSQAFSMSNTGYALQTQEAIKGYQSTMASLKEESEELAQKYKDLGLIHDSNLLMFEPPISIGIKIGESPDDYYSRSIHSSNIGTAVYYVVENSVSIGLRLPTFRDVLNNLEELKE